MRAPLPAHPDPSTTAIHTGGPLHLANHRDLLPHDCTLCLLYEQPLKVPQQHIFHQALHCERERVCGLGEPPRRGVRCVGIIQVWRV